jgi:TonB family protein
MLRVTSNAGTSQVLHNRILRFQEHYVAGDLTIISNGKPILTAHVDSIVPLDAGSEAQFAPAADAVLLPRRVNISAGVAVGMLEKHDAPDYPLDARMSHISGTVVLQAIINTEGHIKELKVVSGPSQLQQAALEAVHKWRYRPYLLNGEPVEVLTTVNVVFTLGR